ncbi:MAG: TRAP transporter substrate-binding protein [Deltaproteobacteria bacterium]|nr:TRAP transporter substrate-binding protein [Deltaproteobacteria bacterium]
MKKIFLIPCFFLIVSALVLGAFFQMAQAGDKSLVLRLAHSTSPKSKAHSEFLVPWTKEIEKVTGGRVRVDIYPSATLVDKKALLEGVKKGRADIAWGCTLYWRGRFHLSEVLALPMLGIKSGESASRIYWRLYQEFPEVRAEYADLKMLFTNYIGPYIITTAEKPVKSVADVKGLKIRAGGGVQTEVMKALGAVPSYMGFADLYQALDKGVMDGALLPWEAISSFKFYEVVDYALDEPLSGTTCFCVMNQEKWNSLPPDIQEGIGEISYEEASAGMGRVYDVKEQARALVARSGQKLEVNYLSPSEREKLREKIRPIWDKWIADARAKGLPGQKVLDRTLELAKELSQ